MRTFFFNKKVHRVLNFLIRVRSLGEEVHVRCFSFQSQQSFRGEPQPPTLSKLGCVSGDSFIVPRFVSLLSFTL